MSAQDNYMTMLRTERYKLVYYAFQESDGELYDLERDSAELFNRYSDQNHAAVRRDLLESLLSWSMRSAYQTAGYKNRDVQTPLFWPQENKFLHHAAIKRPDSWYSRL